MQRVLAAVAGLTTALALAACGGGSTAGPSGEGATGALQATSEPAARPDKGTGPVDREVHELTGFKSPSGNVGCSIDMDSVRCDISERNWAPPPRPADCEFDYGQGITLSPGEPAQFVCAGDTALTPEAGPLPYGDSITAGILRCESAESRITCLDRKTGHGFSISREAYQLF